MTDFLIRGPVLAGLLLLAACTSPNYFLIHPQQVPAQVRVWSEDHTEAALQIHLHWAQPPGDGPFATVLVHPHGGKTSAEMQGVIWDLAARGYMAVAADYRRLLQGEYRRNTFAWRSEEDVIRALRIVRAHPQVDAERIAALGFSQGGMFSLLMAAHAPGQLRAVIAYYPVADFNSWFDREKHNFIEDWIYAIMRRHFYKESGAADDGEFRQILARASPLNYVDKMDVPIYLVHGDGDNAAPVAESRKLYQALQAAGKRVELLVIPGGVHIFNWRQEARARQAWTRTLQWLQRHLQ